MEGTLSVEQGSLYDFMDICAVNSHRAFAHPLGRALNVGQSLLRRLHQHNPVRARAGQRRPSLRPVGSPVRPVPGQRPAIFLRLLHPSA